MDRMRTTNSSHNNGSFYTVEKLNLKGDFAVVASTTDQASALNIAETLWKKSYPNDVVRITSKSLLFWKNGRVTSLRKYFE